MFDPRPATLRSQRDINLWRIPLTLSLANADERAGLLSAFYLEGYLAFSLPAALTGFLAPIVGLVLAADVYGAAVILMAGASLVAIGVSRLGVRSDHMRLIR